MYKRFIAIFVLAAGSAVASVETDVVSVVHQLAHGISKMDGKAIAASCADRAFIVDNIPPHEWSGESACARWFADFQVFVKKAEITDAVVTVGEAGHVDITADVAYVVAPATLAFRVKGKPAQANGIITVVLRKTAADWRITALTWAEL